MKRLYRITAGLLVVGLTLFGCATMSGGDSVTLFDGKNLDHWYIIGDADWKLENGLVMADRKIGKENGYLVTRKNYSNFQLRVEFWVSHDANSGIFMRCKDGKKIADSLCYEANIFDQRGDPYFGTGAIVKFAGVDPMPKAGGKWNTYEITADGPNLTLVLNGVKTVELNNKKFKKGPIALQYGKGVVKFRKVQIREL
jgi:hypothetical protein